MPYKHLGADDLFSCRQCGDCCRGYGGTYVTADDIAAIAAFIKVDAASFEGKYCRMSGGRPVLAQKPDGFCIFFDKLCTIHPVKPKMCRAWPFIRAVVADPGNWHIMAGFCPGMRTDIPEDIIRKVTLDEIKKMS